MERIDSGRPISHVAAEAGVSRQRLGVWYRRWRAHGEQGLEDRPSTPVNMPKLLSEDIGDLIEEMRRGKKFGPARISGELALLDIKVSTATVHRELVRRGINRLRTLDNPALRNYNRRRCYAAARLQSLTPLRGWCCGRSVCL